jgi:hypothetical protein
MSFAILTPTRRAAVTYFIQNALHLRDHAIAEQTRRRGRAPCRKDKDLERTG